MVSVNAERYRHMIVAFLQPTLNDNEMMWFQQDDVTAHTARVTMDLLREIFDEKLTLKNSEINLPVPSPDLSAPDNFLWEYLEDIVYVNKLRTV